MPETDVKRALELLRNAHDLLNESKIENLKKSASYLEESIYWLERQKTKKTVDKQEVL